MKRVVEEVTDLDTQIGSLFEEGVVKTTNSDSSRRALSHLSGMCNTSLVIQISFIGVQNFVNLFM